MEYKSVFDFLKDDEEFYDIYRDCLSMERQIILKSFDMSFVKGRIICEKLIKKIAKSNSKVSNLFSRKKPNGKPYNPGLAETIGECRDNKVISKNISKKYYKIKKFGDAGAHGDNVDKYNISHCKNVHKMVFDITIDCYNEFNYPKKVHYFYGLDKSNNDVEITSDDRKEDLKSLHLNEVNPDSVKEYYNSKKIFLNADEFKKHLSEDLGIDGLERFKNLPEDGCINDENIDQLLCDVGENERNKIKVIAEKLSLEKSKKVIETLNELNNDLTFDEINELIVSANDGNKREIYGLIKQLSIDLVKNHLAGIKDELEDVPVTYIDENGKKVSKHEKYDIEEDENGLFLKICLDEEQKSAVMYNGSKPLVINAGPGSGKTRILVERVSFLINELNIDPSTILIITFTAKAAKELKNKLINETDLPVDVVNILRVETIHHFCNYLISSHEIYPYNFFKEYDEKLVFFSNFKKELGFVNYATLYDGWIPKVFELYAAFFNFGVDIDEFILHIKSKMNNRRCSLYRRYIDDFHEKYGHDHFPDYKSLSNKFKMEYYYHILLNTAVSYPKYKQLMEERKICDMDFLLENAHNILKRDGLSFGFPYTNILIDEFQDVDFNEMNIFKKLQEFSLNNGGTFTIVGDSDQSIYGWKGSSSSFFESCVKDPDFQLITIKNNYRSSGNIVKFNEELIKNHRSIEKNSIPVKHDGNPVFYLWNSEVDEADNVMNVIKCLKEDKKIKCYGDVALLFRTNRDLEKFAQAFENNDFPFYTFTQRHDFLNQNEVKSMLALFWLLMPYQKNKLIHRSEEFLKISWLSDDYFGLSKETQDILNNIQITYERNAVRLARKSEFLFDRRIRIFKYSSIFDLEKEIVDYVFGNVETVDLLSLEVNDLIELGITNLNDLEFFSKLKNLKSVMWSDELSDSQKPDLIEVFNALLNITDYYKVNSISNDEHSIKIKNNLALFSQIIYKYCTLIDNKDYLGLFEYLNLILGRYSCPKRDEIGIFDKVHLMTMHMAKGLEYPVVILCSLSDRFFSNRFKLRSFYPIPSNLMSNKPSGIEKNDLWEEMRVIYVAATRARDLLILSADSSNNQILSFLRSLEIKNVKIEHLQFSNLNNIKKISSSLKQENKIVKTLNLGKLLSDYLYCPYKYDVINNTCFCVSIDDLQLAELYLHQLIYRVHGNYNVDGIKRLIKQYVQYGDLSPDEIKTIGKVEDYWNEYGKNYDVLKSDVFLRKQMGNCEVYGTVDLIIKESDNEISIVQFIISDDKISDFIDEYMMYLHFYGSILRVNDEFKEYKIRNMILHSMDNGNVHMVPYQSSLEEDVLNRLEGIANNIIEEKFDKNMRRCVNCECYGNHCKIP